MRTRWGCGRKIDCFGTMLRETMRSDDGKLRFACLEMFVTTVSVSDHEVVIESGVSVGLPVKEGAGPIVDREWRTRRDSNPRPRR